MSKRSAGGDEPRSCAVGTDFGSPPPERVKTSGIRDRGSGGYRVPPGALPRAEPSRTRVGFARIHAGRPLVAGVVLFCLAIASVSVWGAVVVRQRDMRMRDHGVPVSATVTEVNTSSKGSVSVVVSFVTRDGRKIVVQPESFARAQSAYVGQTRTLKYDPEQPEGAPQDIGVPPDEWSAFVVLLVVAGLSTLLGTGFWLSAQLARSDVTRAPADDVDPRRPKGKAARRRRAS